MRKLLIATLTLLPALAHAHPGHATEAGFVAGLWHPLTGWDHLAGIALAGVLLGWLPGRLRWLTCAAFLALLGVTHALWSPLAQGDYLAGRLAASAGLIAAGMTATRLAKVTASAAR